MSNFNTTLQSFATRVWQPQKYTSVLGYCDPRFASIKDDFARIQPFSGNAGSALTVFYDGKPVVDLYAGSMDKVNGALLPWHENTMALSFSCGKAVIATLVHIMVSEGILDYDVPIADYWAAFGKNGKAHITLRHVLCHKTGLFNTKALSENPSDLFDWQCMMHAIENMAPEFEVNTKVAYQAVSYGFILGGLIEKVTQKPLKQVLVEKLLKPLGIENDFFFGVPDTQLHRVARVIDRKKPINAQEKAERKNQQNTLAAFAIENAVKPVFKFSYDVINDMRGINSSYYFKALAPNDMVMLDFSSDEVFQCCAPAFNGVFTTKAMATIYAMLAQGGEWQGKQLISKPVFDTATSLQNNEVDQVFLMHMRWRLGYHKVLTLGKQAPAAFGHSGYNGTMSFCDPSRKLSFSYVHNFKNVMFATDLRLNFLSQQVLNAVDKL